ncbi:response regulator transcription factor [Proteiniphilum sp. UBA5384]|uniref:response regulator transcription factor n=1 Tax=Proteiniphilum sp. UBA5384 TaxID=1947279 RepID=UPI0025D842CA|nr:response regulator transcription factor [Proteiniphilum sp. UBA5384]
MNEQKTKVLLVDDDTLLGNEIVRELNKKGCDVTYLNTVYGVSEAILKINPDVLVFDVEIGEENGIELAHNLYDGNPSLPIVFISSHHEEQLKEKGLLLAGAVAYLDKPFSAKLLMAHIDRFTRERKSNTSNTGNQPKKVGNILFDLQNRAIITEKGKIKELRPMEFNILEKLASYFGETVSREDIFEAAWKGQSDYYNDQSLNNYIRRLRTLLEEDTNLEIASMRGMGYQLREVLHQ